MTSRQITILGTGALATVFAAKLAAIKVPVLIIGSWCEGLEALNNNGAVIEGQSPYPVHAIDVRSVSETIKQSILLVKTYQTREVITRLRNHFHPEWRMLVLQNGLMADDIIDQKDKGPHLIRGITTIGASLVAPGVARISGEGPLWVEDTYSNDVIVCLLRDAGFDIVHTKDIKPHVWGKLVINAAINPLTAILNYKNGQLLTNDDVLSIMEKIIKEAVEVTTALDIKLPYDDPLAVVQSVARETSNNISSMLADFQRHGQTEIEAINGQIVSKGEEKGISVNVNTLMVNLVNGKRRLKSKELINLVNALD